MVVALAVGADLGALTLSPPVSLGLARVSAMAGATQEAASSMPRPRTCMAGGVVWGLLFVSSYIVMGCRLTVACQQGAWLADPQIPVVKHDMHCAV